MRSWVATCARRWIGSRRSCVVGVACRLRANRGCWGCSSGSVVSSIVRLGSRAWARSRANRSRISNQSASEGRSEVGQRGGRNEDYDERTKDELLDRAREIGIEGRSKMTKRELVDALRNH